MLGAIPAPHSGSADARGSRSCLFAGCLPRGSHWHDGSLREYVHIPLWTIIDGVEYASNPDVERYLTMRIDTGLAGIGMARYSGRSVQRRFPGLDSNNSSFDFVMTDRPTPGYH